MTSTNVYISAYQAIMQAEQVLIPSVDGGLCMLPSADSRCTEGVVTPYAHGSSWDLMRIPASAYEAPRPCFDMPRGRKITVLFQYTMSIFFFENLWSSGDTFGYVKNILCESEDDRMWCDSVVV